MRPLTLGGIVGRRYRQDAGEVMEIIKLGQSAPVSHKIEERQKPDLEGLLPENEPLKSIARQVADGKVEETKSAVKSAMVAGIDALTIAIEGLLKGMDAISTLYNHRQAYVPEILLASKALYAGMEECGSRLDVLKRKGIVLIHTADGDLHDIGKNIVAAIVEANGYRVIDLGTSVDPVLIIDAVKKHKPLALIGSSLMTSTRSAFLVSSDMLKKENIDIPFIVGGGACDAAFAKQRDLIYAQDPNAVVRILDGLHPTN
ncbi:MAG TPA: hypothetical protein HA257_06980 [Candidatus Methanoperedenaceae archaeon]|nr:hypothetical protein [Candidatus Methanoperedenaceae archaeon]